MATAPKTAPARRAPMSEALARHWPEYLMEAAELALFMMSACVFTVLLEHPSSPLNQGIESADLRHAINGLAMGLTAIAIIYSPLGQRSGAHFNPAVTATFFLLGKIERWDAAFYVTAQFLGGVAGVVVSAVLIGVPALAHSAVNYVATVPGPRGAGIAFTAEFLISFALMSAVLLTANNARLSRFTPLVAGSLVAMFIAFEAPLSGMSMNPARTLGSAAPAREWTALWVYFTAPPLGMLLAGLLYRVRRGAHAVFCAKLHHHNHRRCIFRCHYTEM